MSSFSIPIQRSSPPAVPFARPDITDQEIKAVERPLKSGILSTGRECGLFEREAADFLKSPKHPDSPKCIATTSATSGFEILFRSLGVGPGTEVIFPAITYNSPAMEAKKLGATVRFVDIDPDTHNMSLGQTFALVNDKTSLVVPTHFAGYPIDIPDWMRVLPPHVHVIDDAAHAFSSTLNGQWVGDQGATASVFSFYATKPLTTGEGGMIVTRDVDESFLRTRRLDGVVRNCPDDPAMQWDYDVLFPGLKANMPDTAAAIGRVQLRRQKAMRARRTEIASAYDFAFANLPIRLPPRPGANGHHSWHLYVIELFCHARRIRNDVIRRLYDKGVQCSVHFKPLNHLKALYEGKTLYPNAEAYYENCISLPIFSSMTDDQVQMVIDSVKEVLR